MSTKIGQFEILSELAKSPTSSVYKANDPEGNQTIALKAIQLSAFGESSEALEQALLAEAESTKILSSPNIGKVFGAGEIDGQYCAAMEYVQGNSIATMLARKEGFSIWDLLDIGRQLCSGFDHASSHKLVHYSLEPSKIMCGWDGTVKILSFGVSSVGNFAQHVTANRSRDFGTVAAPHTTVLDHRRAHIPRCADGCVADEECVVALFPRDLTYLAQAVLMLIFGDHPDL